MTKHSPIHLGIFSIIIFIALIQKSFSKENNVTELPTVTVSSKKEFEFKTPLDFPGTLYRINQKEITKRQTNDINRILRDVPSVNLQEEDGYGIRPNIGIRGSKNDRSADIVIMEDGILSAPAPYSAPAAYYFPAIGRISGIEVYKGAGSIKYGPRTTSGVLNIITIPIPKAKKGTATTSIGSFNEKNANMNFGNSYENFGYVINLDHKSSDGFKEIDGGKDMGFEVNDFMTKFRFNNDKSSDIQQKLEFKLSYTEENSKESYVGLTHSDFVDNPYRRYMSTKHDNMDATRSEYQVSYEAKFSKNFDITTTAYHHEFDRIWYRLNKIDTDTTDGVSSKKTSSIFNNNLESYIDIIRGNASSYSNNELEISANNRSFVSRGIQSIANSKFNIANTKHNLKYGIRIHNDYEDRFQRPDKYKIVNGALEFVSRGIDGTGSGNNRIGKVRAYSAFTEDKISFGKWMIVPGLRFEHIELKQRDFGSDDPTRSSPPGLVKNKEDVLIPAIGVNYMFTDNFTGFAGVHKGFGPPSPGSTASVEESINYETGLRFVGENNLFLEGVLFLNDYSNLVGTDSSADGAEFNGGKVQSYGIELVGSYDFIKRIMGKSVIFPIKVTYGYNHSEFKTSLNSSQSIEEWGNVSKGDLLPYVSPHQFSISVGAEIQKFNINLSTKYVDAMRTTASRGKIAKENKIPSHFVADTTIFYQLKHDIQLFTAVDNIFNRKYAVASRPAGYRPGKPLTFRVGAKIDF